MGGRANPDLFVNRGGAGLTPGASHAKFEQDSEIGIITICDPPLNLFSFDLIAELTTATAEAQVAPIRALLLRSEGEHFTAGAQVKEVFGNLTAAEGEARIAGFLSSRTVPSIESLLSKGPGHATFRGH